MAVAAALALVPLVIVGLSHRLLGISRGALVSRVFGDEIRIRVNEARWGAVAVYELMTLSDEPPREHEARRSELPRLIFHAGGAINDKRYTNSREAVEQTISRGGRLVELDVNWTSDSQLVCIHDWKATWSRLGRGGAVPKLREFMTGRIAEGTLTPLSLHELDTLARRFPNMRIVTDIKERNVDALALIARTHPRLVEAIIPQVYSMHEYDAVRTLGFSRIILTTYLRPYPPWALLRFAAVRPLVALTIPLELAVRDYAPKLRSMGIPVFTHTVNSVALADSLIHRGIHGVYTDSIGLYTPWERSP